MSYYAGIDIGSTAIKIVIIDENEEIVGKKVSGSGSMFYKYAKESLEQLVTDIGIERDDIAYIVATGYGRKLFKEADETISEITANAIGAKKAGEKFGKVRTIINIGGQDSKAISLDENGNVVNFAMNDRCAAGTGKFLDVAAAKLEIDVEELGEYHFKANGTPLSINSTCAVFAESEIIGLLGNEHSKEDIVAGIHFSIAKRIIRLTKKVGLNDIIYFDGGPALNAGLVAAIEDELGRELAIPSYPQITTALGAALMGTWVST
ncbi:acyl-CoA dehydratase activase [Hydrogenimonas thermophila]|uniref:acyl-CoA dehydratase activase n=1 Tax=Hydrogenimonas thermophila TaxID=223786 RepID=UPI0029370CE1|nr:acyl-CoA dehydratase activase [Hydrogenimonas thermophila]WOE70561.1 acyl-CoA dehydratase activase [Hydrogenimonas thermophila]WOE73077.1 acyl-CoA dehydratase activase [Hydrogenimonas thermophila]